MMARSGHLATSGLSPLSGVKRKSDLRAVRSAYDPGRVKTFFLPKKLHATGRDPRRRDRLSIFLVYRVWSQSGRNLELILSDLNGHTAHTTAHAPHARIATRSGLIPRMFITRVRL